MRRRLLAWYRRRRRDLPWRRDATPYRVWVSEIMLQQTTVAAVAPRYEAFLARFPDLASLARASEGEVLAAWAGLGYYSRARNLREAARRVVAERGGVFPDDLAGVLALPGVGRYTAAAVLSIAFGKPHAVLDGNVMRVLSRLRAVRAPLPLASTQRRLWALADELLDRRSPGDWNQAMMELGATVCAPESPACPACPLAGDCEARRLGLQDRLPDAGKRRAPVDLAWTCLWAEDRGRVLLWRRADDERFLRGHWGLPEARHLGRLARRGRRLRTVRHAITHHRIRLELREARVAGPLPERAAWVPRARVRESLVSSLWLKALPAGV